MLMAAHPVVLAPSGVAHAQSEGTTVWRDLRLGSGGVPLDRGSAPIIRCGCRCCDSDRVVVTHLCLIVVITRYWYGLTVWHSTGILRSIMSTSSLSSQ